jgi:hypothetical protein
MGGHFCIWELLMVVISLLQHFPDAEGRTVHNCRVCENPRRLDLSTSQIEWHNLGHPGIEAFHRQADPGKLRAVVVIRPGDQILYEIKPGKWCRIDELDVAIAGGHSVQDLMMICRRCSRRVLERRPGAGGFWRSLMERMALITLRRTN